MSKNILTKELEDTIIRETSNNFGCLEVTLGPQGSKRVDYMSMDNEEIFRCYEIKISESDFNSSCGHNFVGNYNYYVMPMELYELVRNKIPENVGAYLAIKVWNTYTLKLIKKAKYQEVTVDKTILKNSLIRALYRDVCKYYKSNDKKYLENQNQQIKELKKRYEDLNAKYCELSNDMIMNSFMD